VAPALERLPEKNQAKRDVCTYPHLRFTVPLSVSYARVSNLIVYDYAFVFRSTHPTPLS